MRRLFIIAVIMTAAILFNGEYWRPFLGIALLLVGLIELQVLLDRRRAHKMRDRSLRLK
jgi:hypothetical protein